MKRTSTVLATASAAIALAVGVPLSAHAATGTFQYENQQGSERALIQPVDYRCYQITGLGIRSHNQTNRKALLFRGNFCQGAYKVVNPGRSSRVHFMSVKFVRR